MAFVIMNDPVQLILVFDFLKIFILKILTVENRSFLEHWLIFQGNDWLDVEYLDPNVGNISSVRVIVPAWAL